MILEHKFDVLRGWPQEGAIDETFPINQTTPGTDDSLPIGTIVEIDATSGGAKASTTPNRTSADAKDVYVVVAGNDDFSSQFVHKIVGLRSNAEFRLDYARNCVAGSFTRGSKLSFSAGKWKVAAINEQIIGHVLVDNSATSGTVDVHYTGGDTAKL